MPSFTPFHRIALVPLAVLALALLALVSLTSPASAQGLGQAQQPSNDPADSGSHSDPSDSSNGSGGANPSFLASLSSSAVPKGRPGDTLIVITGLAAPPRSYLSAPPITAREMEKMTLEQRRRRLRRVDPDPLDF